MKKVSFVLALAMIFALCAAFCGCSGELMKLPMIGEDAQAVTISSGACKMNVNDSISKFTEIFGGLELVEIKPENVFGGVNEKYPSALAEIEGAHHVVVTLADGNETEFYFTDDGSVYYLDGETVFASDSPIDATAALATAKVENGLAIGDILNTDAIDSIYVMSLLSCYPPEDCCYLGKARVTEFLQNVLYGINFTDNADIVSILQMEAQPMDSFDLLVYPYNDELGVLAVITVLSDGRTLIEIDDKFYATAENNFVSVFDNTLYFK